MLPLCYFTCIRTTAERLSAMKKCGQFISIMISLVIIAGCQTRNTTRSINVNDNFRIVITYTPTSLADGKDGVTWLITDDTSRWEGDIFIKSHDKNQFRGIMTITTENGQITQGVKVSLSEKQKALYFIEEEIQKIENKSDHEIIFRPNDFLFNFDDRLGQWTCSNYTNKSGVVVSASMQKKL
jgi:major membrane immunogen (membrane-anchored lipoprotein)